MDIENFKQQSEIISAFSALDKVLTSGVLEVPGHPLFEAAFTCVLIHLNDLLQKANGCEKRVVFSDDVVVHKGVADVTTLINHARNAACHVGSAIQDFGLNRIRMNVTAGYVPNAIQIDDDTFGCDYADDIAVQYGPIRVYLGRHVYRAIQELRGIFPQH